MNLDTKSWRYSGLYIVNFSTLEIVLASQIVTSAIDQEQEYYLKVDVF